MKRTHHVTTLCIAVLGAVLAALPAVAAIELTDLQAEVQNRAQGRGPEFYGIKPAQPVPLGVGETVRVALVGTTGNGAQVPVGASFSVAAGSQSIRLGRSGANWIEVTGVGAGGNGLAQLGYQVTDRRYAMRGALSVGRITFQMGGGAPTSEPAGDSRLQASRRVARALYRTLLGSDLRSQRAQDDVDRIDRRGYAGIRQVAAELARASDAQRYFAGQSNTHVMGELYRGLLGRQQDDTELQYRDNGFRGSVEGLRRNGLVRSVEEIVSSPEFQSTHQLQANGLL
jgi:hypothetical protein